MFTINVPNVLTLLRILLVPVLVVALLDQTSDGDVLAAIVFALASLTDAIDGYIARSRNAITTFGKLMDPVADKLLIVAALFSLVSLHRLPAWVAMVIVAREFAVTMTRMAAAPTGRRDRRQLVGQGRRRSCRWRRSSSDRVRRLAAVARPADLRDGRDHGRSAGWTTSSGCAGCCARPRTAGFAR